jgi:SPP1 family phage portal protein
VVYSYDVGNKPVYAVNVVIVEGRVHFDVYTRTKVFHVLGGEVVPSVQNVTAPVFGTAINLQSVEPNYLGRIPIIEYKYNSVNESAFEPVISLLDAINQVASNRLDGIDQFIQSLAVAVNCEFEEGTTANDIRKAGMVILKAFGDRKPDFKILSEELNQDQTQVFVDYMYKQVLTISGVPDTTKGGSSTSDNGIAVMLRDGWATADTYARNTRDLFLESNSQFDDVFLYIVNKQTGLDINKGDFELRFAENEMSQIQSKATAYQTLVKSGLHPILALQKSGVSNDPVKDFEYSKKYMDMVVGDPDKPQEVTPVQEENGGAKQKETAPVQEENSEVTNDTAN